MDGPGSSTSVKTTLQAKADPSRQDVYEAVIGQRIPYPKLAVGVVDSINAVIAAGKFLVPGEGGSISVVPTIAPDGYDAWLTLSFTVGGSPVRVRLNRAAVDCALGGLVDAPAFATLDDDLKLAVLETALDAPLGALTAWLRADVVLEGIAGERMDAAGAASRRPDGDAAAPFGGLLFEARRPPEVVCCAVLVDLVSPLPASVVERLVESPAVRTRDLEGLPVPVTFELGAASLSPAEFRSLEPGDIVLFDQCHVVEGRLRVNICDRFFLVGELEGHGLTVQGGF